jgi:hypothetical protein
MRFRNSLLAGLLASVLLLASCATSPANETRASGIRLLAPADIAKFGNTFEINPLLPPSSFIRGKVERFVVIEFTIRTERSEMVSAWSRLEDAAGNSLGSAMSRNDLIEFRATYTADPADAKGRDKLSRIYLPGDEFRLGKGLHTYYQVMRLPAGSSQGLHVIASIAIGDQDPIKIDEELPSGP